MKSCISKEEWSLMKSGDKIVPKSEYSIHQGFKFHAWNKNGEAIVECLDAGYASVFKFDNHTSEVFSIVKVG